jgi:hypothetical protein
MRIPFRRKVVTSIAAIVAVTAIGIVTSQTPAEASVGKICLTYGLGCVGAPNIGTGDPVVLTATGREINLHDRGYKCCGGYEVFQLQMSADTSKCVGVPDGGFFTTIRLCSSGNTANVNWAFVPDFQADGAVYFWSPTLNGYLASDNIQGDSLFTSQVCPSRCFLKWTVP